MQKVYLLLRSNKQTGPYSLEELLHLNLKPFDLVWVEGRSAAWQYPSEIPSLKPYVPETPHADVPFKPIATAVMEEKFSTPENSNPAKTEIPKKVFVSTPKIYSLAIEQKAFPEQAASNMHEAYMPSAEQKEEIKISAASYTQSATSHPQQKPVEEDVMHTNYSRPLNGVEEDYTNWVYKQKTKKKASVNPKDLVLTVFILAVIAGGYYVMSRPSVVHPVLPANKAATQIIQQPIENNADETGTKEILLHGQRVVSNTNNVSGTNNISVNSKPAMQSKNLKKKNPLTVSKNQNPSSVAQGQNPMPVEKTNSNIQGNNNDISFKEPEVKQQQEENLPSEKKKKLGDVIKNIFTKKEKKEQVKNDQAVLENSKSATNRQATKRNTGDNSSNDNSHLHEINSAALMEQVRLSSNAPDNWMMGVKNLKIILQNRSSVTIQAASVTVNYYNENNELLERKLVYFSNVPPKSKAAVAAPDHKFADHVDFNLATVSAKEDRYASY